MNNIYKRVKSVAIIYPYFAHYRLPVLQELMKSNEINYTLISDSDSGFDVKTINPALANKNIEDGGLRWKFVANKWFLPNTILWQRGLLSLLKHNNFDSVIFLGNAYYLSTWAAIIYLKYKEKKIFLWTHGVTNNKKNFKWYFRKSFYSLGNGLLLYENNAKDVMIKHGFSENKLHVIYNSLDYKQQLKYRHKIDHDLIFRTKQELFENNSLPYIVFVGRLTPQKKLYMIVEAIKLLFENNIKVNTLFVGKGEAKTELENLVLRYGLQDYFNFYGPCFEEEQLSRLIGSADICVSPGNVGLTAMTALGYGTPVISHDDFNHQMPEYQAIKPNINGDLFRRGSIKDLANKISKWLSTKGMSPREEIQKKCFEVIDTKYNPKNQATLINEIILKNEC